MEHARFQVGDRVYKHTGDYRGPGVVRGITTLPNNKPRYLVGHKIEGGEGELLHIYAPYNLRPIDPEPAESS
jgi:hypothetical protein